MEALTITSGIDVALVVLYAFWIFFAGLVFYLRREDRREGYPLESEVTGKPLESGVIWIPKPKVFNLAHGGTQMAPRDETDTREIQAKPVGAWPGAPLRPTGNPMVDGVGPAAYALRSTSPELNMHGEPRIAPMRLAKKFSVETQDPDPRGMAVIGADGVKAGTVFDIWVDRSEPQISYLEVDVHGLEGSHRVLLPITFARIDGRRRQVRVKSILARQFFAVPVLENPDQVTSREEDRICSYYAGGHLYATRARQEPLL